MPSTLPAALGGLQTVALWPQGEGYELLLLQAEHPPAQGHARCKAAMSVDPLPGVRLQSLWNGYKSTHPPAAFDYLLQPVPSALSHTHVHKKVIPRTRPLPTVNPEPPNDLTALQDTAFICM